VLNFPETGIPTKTHQTSGKGKSRGNAWRTETHIWFICLSLVFQTGTHTNSSWYPKVVLHEILNICSEILKWFLSCFFDTHPFDHGWNWFSSSRWPSILSTWNSHSSCCICSSRWISTLSLSSDYNCRRLQWISESIFVTRCWISFTQSWIIRVILYGPVHLALTWGFSSEDPPQVQQSLDHWSWGERPL